MFVTTSYHVNSTKVSISPTVPLQHFHKDSDHVHRPSLVGVASLILSQNQSLCVAPMYNNKQHYYYGNSAQNRGRARMCKVFCRWLL